MERGDGGHHIGPLAPFISVGVVDLELTAWNFSPELREGERSTSRPNSILTFDGFQETRHQAAVRNSSLPGKGCAREREMPAHLNEDP